MSRKKKSLNELLDQIHSDLAKDLHTRLKEGELVQDKEGNAVLDPKGNPLKRGCSVATLNVIRQFLKDNGIEGVPTASPVVQDILDSLPSFDEPDEDQRLRPN